MTKQYTELKQEIINANMGDGEYLDHKIGIADVLIALQKIGCLTYGANSLINITGKENEPMVDVRWDLKKDFNGQRTKTLDFLEETLVKKKEIRF